MHEAYIYFIAIFLILVTIALILFIPILRENAVNKMGGKDTSGVVRFRDFIVGIELIKEKPIIGHGQFTTEYLMSKDYVSKIESGLFSKEYIKASGDMGGGYTNGLLGLIVWYGVPITIGSVIIESKGIIQLKLVEIYSHN